MCSVTSRGSPVVEVTNHWLAAYYLLKGGKIIDIQPGKFVRFLLDNHDGQADEASQEFYAGTAQAPIRQYGNVVRYLRMLMNRVQNGEEINLSEFKRPA